MDYKKLYEEQKKKYEKLEEWNNIVRKAHQGIAEENNMLIEGKIKLSEKFWEKENKKLNEQIEELKEENKKLKKGRLWVDEEGTTHRVVKEAYSDEE